MAYDPNGSYRSGKIKGDVYYNESCNMKFTLPEGWHFCSQEEIDAINDASTGNDDPFSVDYITKIRAENEDGSQYFSWDVGKSSSSSQGFQTFRESELNSHRQRLSESGDGITDVVVEKGTVLVAGEDAPSMMSSCAYSGVSVYEEQVVWLQGGTAVNLSVFCVQEDVCAAILGSVTAMTLEERIDLAQGSSKGASASASAE